MRCAAADWVWPATGWHGNMSVRHGDTDGGGPVAGVTLQQVSICVRSSCASRVRASVSLITQTAAALGALRSLTAKSGHQE